MTTKAKTARTRPMCRTGALKAREQLLSAVQQSQDLTVGVLQAWTQSVGVEASRTGASWLPTGAGCPGGPGVAATGYTVDLRVDRPPRGAALLRRPPRWRTCSLRPTSPA